jgi:hypothetical protein
MTEKAKEGVKVAATTCRDELLNAVRSVVTDKGENEFTPKEVIDFMMRNKTIYKESTIRTHIVSKCCIDANQNHKVVFNDYKRLGNGKYGLINFK